MLIPTGCGKSKEEKQAEAAQAAIADLQATIQQASENMANRTVFENGSNSLAFHNVAYDYATEIFFRNR